MVGNDEEGLEKWILELIEKTKTDWTDVYQLEPTEGKIPIAKMRELINWLHLKNYQSEYKIAVIKNAEVMDANSSNTFLKKLEEPSGKAIIVLTVNDKDAVLPTIRSRCRVVRVQSQNQTKEKGESVLLTKDIVANFTLAENLAKDEDLIKKIDQLILDYREKLIAGDKEKARDLKKILAAKKLLLTTNTSPRLILENLFLNLA